MRSDNYFVILTIAQRREMKVRLFNQMFIPLEKLAHRYVGGRVDRSSRMLRSTIEDYVQHNMNSE